MHIEIQVALNFLISFLYNKLPRRRVNQFGEELEKILRKKFDGHWYPEKPYKGSAYRCIHCNPQLDSSLFREAARNSGLNLKDVQENLPHELSIWIDPGEVSYRMSEKGPVNILYDSKVECGSTPVTNHHHGETTATTIGLNPEAQCFQPVMVVEQMRPLSVTVPVINHNHHQEPPPAIGTFSNKNDPVTFTTAAFAATKFGSTKPKVQMSKKYQRGSPTATANDTNKPFFPTKCNPRLLQKQQQQQLDIANNKFNKFPNHNLLNSNDANIPLQSMNPFVYSTNDIINETSKPIMAPSPRYRAWPASGLFPNNTDTNEIPSQYPPNATMIMENISPPEYSLQNGFLNHLAMANGDDTKTMFPNGTAPIMGNDTDLFENVPALMPDHLLREIFELSGTPGSDDLTTTIKPPNVTPSPPATGNTTGGTPETGESVCNDLIDFSGFVHSACLSSPSWSSTELSPVNLMANEFDNLSLNSTSSSSLGSVSSYVT